MRRNLMVALCAGLLGAGTLVEAKPARGEFRPDVEAEHGLELEGETWRDQGPGYRLEFQRVTEADRHRIIAGTTGMQTDPFAGRPDQPARYLTFALELENRSSGSLVFQPQNCWLVTDKNEILYPTGVDSLRSSYALLEQELPEAYERTRDAFLENTLTLEPGRAVRGLLVYRAPKSKTKRFQVDLQWMMHNGDVVRRSTPYRRLKKRK